MTDRRRTRAASSPSASVTAVARRPDPLESPNPYVGPRPFRRDELFFGREREAKAVINSLLSGRVMLLHSPSGAGKTSLIQSAVVPAFEKRGFLVCATTTPRFNALRVNLPPPPDLPITNRYVFSMVNGLIGHFTEARRACTMTLAQALEEFARHHHAQQKRQLLLVDQLEEVLTLDHADLEGQTAFFRQLGEALDDQGRWALLAIREDYMGALDKFRPCVPGQLRSTFRLDLLGVESAVRAVREPASARRVDFDEAAARLLVGNLALVHSGRGGDDALTLQHPYIEPVLLQVVCYSLFERLSQDQGDDFRAITTQDVMDFKPFDKAVANYYSTVLAEIVHGDHGVERELRDWVEHHLISRRGLRRQTRQLPEVANVAEVLGAMQSQYLIRDDPRPGGAPLWELTHDMLVAPVLVDNRAWRVRYLERWQCLAEEWRTSDRDPQYLLRGADYLAAPSTRKRAGLTDTERAFLTASDEAFRATGRLERLWALLGWLSGLLVLSLVANVVLLILLLTR
jgi:hypothetical protein